MDFNLIPDRILALLWRASWQASVLVLLILLAQMMFGKRLTPKWRYALWLLVVVRLLLPVTPSSAWSVFNVGNPERFSGIGLDRWSRGEPWEVEREAAPQTLSVAQPAKVTAATPINVTAPATTGTATVPPRRSFLQSALVFLRQHLVWIWFLGVLALSMRLAWGNYLFSLQLRRRKPITEPSVLAVLDECRERIGLRRPLTLIEAPELDSPALFGCFRLKLLLPEKLIEHFSPAELRHVFLHELAHVRRRDAAVNWLTTILQTLHWFNPVLWFAFQRMRADRELACDALALAHAHDGESRRYGQTVIKVLEGFTQPTAIPGLVGILEDKKQIKERITMIAQFKPSSGWPVMALALVTLLGCVSLTDGKKQTAGEQNRSGGDATARIWDSAGGAMKASTGVEGQPVVRLVASDKIDWWLTFGGEARPSPNGKYLSYINWDDGNLAFYNVDTGELKDLTSEGTWSGNPNQFSMEGIWSPDSTQVAYLWSMGGDQGELRIVDRDGGKPKTLVPAKLWPQSWSKDGRHILALGPYRKAWPSRNEKMDGILLVDAATGKTNMVKLLPDGDESVTASLSPDGKYIAYCYGRNEPGSTNAAHSDIRIVNIDGSNDRSLIDHPAKDVTPRWMPDGKHLLFASDRSGNNAIWMLPISQGQKAGEPRMVRDITGMLLGTAEDGAVFYSASAPNFNIYVAEADWDSATLGTPRLVSLRYDGKNRNPRWSSDGSRLGYISERDAFVLVFQDAATGKEEDVKADLEYCQRTVWSPDLSRLVEVAKSPTQKGNGLFEVNVKTGRRTILESLAEPSDDVGRPLFTADGKHLIYTKFHWPKRPESGPVELDLATRRERRIGGALGGYGSWGAISPDGSRLATCKNPYPVKEGDKVGLQIASRADGVTKTVPEFPIGEKGGGQVCAWLPDNRRVLVAFGGKQSQQLYLVDADTGSSRPFGPPQPKGEEIGVLSIHPDGKRIAFDRGRTIQEIWAMKNFLPDEKLATK